ncbi:MAG: FAD-dependent oxidoreductase [Longimicrobiales bacterium]
MDLIHGTARFTGPKSMEVIDHAGEVTHRLEAAEIFLNVGARPFIPPLDGLDEVDYLTSASIMELDRAPEHLIVLGGGFIGLEFGQMVRRFGSHVTIVEAGPRIAGREDPDISEALTGILTEDGITVRTGAEALQVRQTAGEGRVEGRVEGRTADGAADGTAEGAANRAAGVELVVETEEGRESLVGSALLVATGRRPNTDLLNLKAAGLETDDRGNIPVDERRRTAVDAGSGRILGAAVLGVDGGEIASALKIAMMGELPYTALRDAVLAHPTLTESLNNLFMTLD